MAAENACARRSLPDSYARHRGKKLRARAEFVEQLHTRPLYYCVSWSVVPSQSRAAKRSKQSRLNAPALSSLIQMAVAGRYRAIGFCNLTSETDFVIIEWTSAAYLLINSIQETMLERVRRWLRWRILSSPTIKRCGRRRSDKLRR